MKIAAAFKPFQLLAIVLGSMSFGMLVATLAPTVLFYSANFLWVPFLCLLGILLFCCFKQTLPIPHGAKISATYSTFIRMLLAFLLIAWCFFGWGQSLLLYQAVTYDATHQAIIVAVSPMTQLLWALKLGLVMWVIAAGLALGMGALHKNKISECLPFFATHAHAGLLMDTIFAFAVNLVLLMLISVTSFELARSIVAYLGFERPIFPEMTAVVLSIVLVTGYYFLYLKKHMERLVKKSASLGRMWLMQILVITFLLLFGQGIILFFPYELLQGLMQPIFNLLTSVNYMDTWRALTVATAILNAPLLARYFARIFAGMPIGRSILLLSIVPLLVFTGLYSQGEFSLAASIQWLPGGFDVPIVAENVIYQPGISQSVLFTGMLALLLCLMFSKTLQQSFVDLMPRHLGMRLRRMRKIIVKQLIILIIFTIIYLFFTLFGYGSITSIFLFYITGCLLWVSLLLLYTLLVKPLVKRQVR